MSLSSLTGWQSVAALAIGASLATFGVYWPTGSALVGLGGAIIGGVLGMTQPGRNPLTRSRVSDKGGPT